MPSATFRIAPVLVRCSGRSGANYFRNENQGGNLRGRLRFLLECVRILREQAGRVLVLPAGFFCVASRRARVALERQLLAALAESDLLIAFGIDETRAGGKAKQAKSSAHSSDGYPYFGYLIERGRILLGPVRQTGVKTDEVDKGRVQLELPLRVARSHLLGGATVALAICGELLSVAWRNALAAQSPDLVLHPAHYSVKLGRAASRSWGPKLDDLIHRLPRTSAWSFADHVMGLRHCAEGNLQPLVRRGGGAAAKMVTTRVIRNHPTGRMYVYNV